MDKRLHNNWAAGKPGINCWLAIPSSVSAEVAARTGFDSVTVDLQHGLNDYTSALPMLQALAASDCTPMARVPWLEAGIIMKLLDAGAMGIICPMINTREDAERFVGYGRYAPMGERSFGPARAALVHGADYAKRANEEVILLAMVETTRALENLDAIASTPGLNGLYIGPSDLSLSMGYEPRLDVVEPAVLNEIKRIREAAHAAGLKAGIHCMDPAYAKRMMAEGFDLVTTLGSDMRAYQAALAQGLAATRG